MLQTEKLYNIQNICELACGDQVFVKRLLTIFITETPATLNTMFDAYKNGDHATIKKLAHRIKPSVKNLGINSIVSDLYDLEVGNYPQETEQKLKRISSILVDVVIGITADMEEVPA